MSSPTISAGAVRALAARGGPSGTAFQAVLVALARAVSRAAERVRAAEQAALSLAQRQKVTAVADDLAATAAALEESLNAQGRCLLANRRSLRERVQEAREKVLASLGDRHEPASVAGSWWFALSEAVEGLDDAASQVTALAESQPAGDPASTLGHEVAAHLQAHRETLLAEADRWVG